jgi:penicillin-binding protein 2
MNFGKRSNFFVGNKKNGKQAIDPDEIFLDSRNLPDFDVHQFEGRIEKPISKNAIQSVGIVFLLIGIIFLGKLWLLQIKLGQAFEIRSQSNSLKRTTIFAERGVIYDRNKVELAWNDLIEGNDFAFRRYVVLDGLSHLVGYVKYPSKDNSGIYYEEVFKGKDGVESYYDEALTGQNGVKLTETDATGKVQSESILTPPTDGVNLILSIDSKIQSKLFNTIKQTTSDRGFTGGAGVIVDVRNGEILALTSYPEYNQNLLTDGSDHRSISSLLNQSGKPFLNRAISGLYIPGSIIKPFIAMGVLQEQVIDPLKQILSTGSISIPNPYDPTKKTIFRDWKAHGWVDMRHAISESSDEYFYTVGGGNGDQKGLGIDNISKYVRMFGFGNPTGINLFGEQGGNVPSQEWKRNTFDGEPWRLGDTYNSSIGQYGFQITPLQVVRGISAFANGGTLVTPTVLLNDPVNDSKSTFLSFSKDNFQVVRDGMHLSAIEGTAKGLNISGLSIAAKTGTAELGVTKVFVNSWVIGFFPYENPRYAFAVLMEKGPKSNSIGATYVMRTLLDWMVINTPEYVK